MTKEKKAIASKAAKKTKNTSKKNTVASTKKATNLKTKVNAQPSPDTSTPQFNRPETITVPKKPLIVVAGILIALVISGIYYYQQQQVVARVNGVAITRNQYLDELESQAGEEILERMITETLIISAAQTEGISVSDEEVDAEIQQARDELTAQGQDLDQLLQFQGITEDQLRQQIRLQTLVSKLAGVSEEATVAEVDAYLEQNADLLPEDMEEAELRSYAQDQLLSRQNSQKIQEYLTNLRAEANIQTN